LQGVCQKHIKDNDRKVKETKPCIGENNTINSVSKDAELIVTHKEKLSWGMGHRSKGADAKCIRIYLQRASYSGRFFSMVLIVFLTKTKKD